jgi:recombinational DNA repair protein (RecF pathway)
MKDQQHEPTPNPNQQSCADCGKPGPHGFTDTERPGSRICRDCYDRETRETCGQCGRTR